MQKRLVAEQTARRRSDEANMQLRLEVNDYKKQVMNFKRDLARLEREAKHAQRELELERKRKK